MDKKRNKEEMDTQPWYSEESLGDRPRTEEQKPTRINKLLLFVLWLGSVLMLSWLDSELVLLLSELNEDGELDCWLLLAAASIFGGGIN